MGIPFFERSSNDRKETGINIIFGDVISTDFNCKLLCIRNIYVFGHDNFKRNRLSSTYI